MDISDELKKLVKAQIVIEEVNVKEAAETEEKLGNMAAKLLLHIIALDSQKHAYVLNGILEAAKDIPTSETLWEHKLDNYVDPFAAKQRLEKHIKREAQMIKYVDEESKLTKDEGLKTLLQYIVEEEKKHHKMLETIIKHMPEK